MARVGLDATSVSAAGKGIARVQLETVAALARADSGHELVALVRSEEATRLVAPFGVEVVKSDHRFTLAWEQVYLPQIVRRHRLDAIVTTSDRLPLVGGTRFVLWLFEAPIHRIEQNRRAGAGAYQRLADVATRLLWKRSVRRASALVTGSHATADEVARLTGVHGTPVYPGIDPAFAPGPRGDRTYVLHLGSSDPRDNTETALEAFTRAAIPRDVRLVIAGGLGARREPIVARARQLGIEDRLDLPGRVTDDELIRLYQAAAVCVEPSLFEGFGYQVLEAMACGTPVVASRVTSLPELVGDAGVLCDPASADEFADAIARVLTDEAFADDLRARGLTQVASFTWDRTARGLVRALDGALAR